MKGDQSLVERVIGVLKLDVPTFEEIEHDQTATGQAAIVVVAVAVLAGIGAGLAGTTGFSIGGLIAAILSQLFGWVVWAAVVYFVGTRFFGGTADLGEMLRVIGFAQAPNALGVLAFIPVLGPIAAFVGSIWALITGVIGVRQGLDVSTGTAIIVMIIGIIAFFVVGLIFATIFGVTALGLGAITG